MPVQLFTEAERAQRDRFPEVIAYEDLVIFFTLSDRSCISSLRLNTRGLPGDHHWGKKARQRAIMASQRHSAP